MKNIGKSSKTLARSIYSMLLAFAFTISFAQPSKPPENTSAYRLKFENQSSNASSPTKETSGQDIKSSYDVSSLLQSKIDSITLKNKKMKYAQGYRILVYTGTSSEEVSKIKEQVVSLVPTQSVYSVYKQPTFRLKVGDYADRVEASSVLYQISKDFPNAIVIQDQILILKDKPSESK
jgi:hypothetical protein